jgi:hypothetical protein
MLLPTNLIQQVPNFNTRPYFRYAKSNAGQICRAQKLINGSQGNVYENVVIAGWFENPESCLVIICSNR